MLGINLGPRGDEQSEGVAIVSVSPGGAAESAGLKAGDVLLDIGGKQLKRDGDVSAREKLLKEMGEVKPGEKVELRYRRDKKVATASVDSAAADGSLVRDGDAAVRGQFGDRCRGMPTSVVACAPWACSVRRSWCR